MRERDVLSMTDSELEKSIEQAAKNLAYWQYHLLRAKTKKAKRTAFRQSLDASKTYGMLAYEFCVRSTFQPPPF